MIISILIRQLQKLQFKYNKATKGYDKTKNTKKAKSKNKVIAIIM